MHSFPINVAFIGNAENRSQTFLALLKNSNARIIFHNFARATQNALFEEPLDLVILDCVSIIHFDYLQFEIIRSDKKLAAIPFIFVIEPAQEKIKRQIYKNPLNIMVTDPVDKFTFVSAVNTALHTSKLEKSNSIYNDIIDSEKKLISYLDDILEMSHIEQFASEDKLLRYLNLEWAKRLELTLAVETVVFANYNSEIDALATDFYDNQGKSVIKRQTFRLSNSSVFKLLTQQLPRIFSAQDSSDPFIQELEESLGNKVESLLFVPIHVFHRPRAAILLINKLYRNDFSESDLAFSLLAAQKISYQLEKIYLEKIQTDAEDQVRLTSIYGSENKIFQEWNFFHSILSSVGFGLMVFDSDFNIEFINVKAEQILKRNLNYKKSKHLSDFFKSEELDHIKSLLQLKELPIIREEIQLSQKNLPLYYIGFSIYGYVDKDKKQKYIFIFSEITQTKRIQAEIIRMDRMASLGVLSSGIAHEVRNPLAGIKAVVQTLEEQMAPNSPHLEYIERILRQVNRLDELLRAFFSYARPQRPDPNAQQIKNIILEVLPLFKRKMQDKNISIEEKYADDLYDVFVDSNQMQQVIFNLFLNAIDAMPDGGRLQIVAVNALNSEPMIDRRRTMPSLLSSKYIEISITDSGIGIPQDLLDKIFNPFFTTKSNGTGLGLSIVYQIIREHGGQIMVESKEGKGTIFKILLPALERVIH